ncbi:hypothetical protein [Aequorivita capsosiphonis]|uniref:hypothetical protein n=1 Tax=Aequorivita capsosiphonis TaxID=487317 RepID=UPI00047E421D|nr:hypothetical protein [Aequorivita capsosiphonis]
MKQLEIGDKMYNVKQKGFNDFMRYSFSEVIELTKTLAVLKNGVKLINKPKTSFFEAIGYSVNRDKSTHWHLMTLEVIRKAQIENKKIEIDDWFNEREFSFEEKKAIYKAFHTSKSEHIETLQIVK